MWAALLHDIAKPDCFTVDEAGRGHFYGHPEAGAKKARVIMRRLGLCDNLVRDVCLLISYHDLPLYPERSSLLKGMSLFAGEGRDAPVLSASCSTLSALIHWVRRHPVLATWKR